MADTFRTLCSELVEKIKYTWGSSIPADVWELLNRACNALALANELAECPLYARQTDTGQWEGADHPCGPWWKVLPYLARWNGAARAEFNIPIAYRLIRRGDGNGNMVPVLQGMFTWAQGEVSGEMWRDLETQDEPYLEDHIPLPLPEVNNG